jgi:hypothetical protein
MSAEDLSVRGKLYLINSIFTWKPTELLDSMLNILHNTLLSF